MGAGRRQHYDEFRTPSLAVGLYDVVIAFDPRATPCLDHLAGFPATEPHERKQRAAERLAHFKQLIDRKPADLPPRPERVVERLPTSQLAPHFPVTKLSGLTSNFAADDYLRAVERAIEYIHAGDIFQVNLTHRRCCTRH